MSARSKARKRALDILFEADSRNVPVMAVLAEHQRRRASDSMQPLNPFTCELVEGVSVHQVAVDQAIDSAMDKWTLERLPLVDRAILRIASYELQFRTDIPTAVSVSEAVELATVLSTDDSPSFVNGVLGTLARSLPV